MGSDSIDLSERLRLTGSLSLPSYFPVSGYCRWGSSAVAMVHQPHFVLLRINRV